MSRTDGDVEKLGKWGSLTVYCYTALHPQLTWQMMRDFQIRFHSKDLWSTQQLKQPLHDKASELLKPAHNHQEINVYYDFVHAFLETDKDNLDWYRTRGDVLSRW